MDTVIFGSLLLLVVWGWPKVQEAEETSRIHTSIVTQECGRAHPKDPLQQKACIEMALKYQGASK